MNRSLLKKMHSTARGMDRGGRAVCRGRDWRRMPAPRRGSAQSQPAAQQGPRTDGQIEMDVVHALDASAALKNDLITAATIQREVTLSGTVSSDASKQLAESIAAHVNGVTKVHNNLTVGNPGPDAQNMQPAPDAQEMPGPDQTQVQQQTAGLPPPGPAPDQTRPSRRIRRQRLIRSSRGLIRRHSRGRSTGARSTRNIRRSMPQAPPAPQYAPASGPVTLPAGTLLQLRTSEPVDSKRAKDGEPVQFMVIQDVTMGGALAIPRGAVVHGVIAEHKNVGSGSMGGSSALALTLTSLDLGGRNYPLASDQFKVKAPNKAGQTVGSALTGGVIGTIIGCAVGRGAGLRHRRRRRCGWRHGSGSGFARLPGLDSCRSAGHLPPGGADYGAACEPAGSGKAGAGSVSRRPGALPPRLPLRIALLRLWIRPGVLRVSGALLSALFHGGRSVLLAVKSRDQGSGSGIRIGHPLKRMPDLFVGTWWHRRSRGARVRSWLAVVYNGRVATQRELRIAKPSECSGFAAAARPVSASARRELKVQIHP